MQVAVFPSTPTYGVQYLNMECGQPKQINPGALAVSSLCCAAAATA